MSAVRQMLFEQVFKEIAPYRKFNKDETGQYYDGGTAEAWKLWQAAKDSDEYVNQPTVALIQDLLAALDHAIEKGVGVDIAVTARATMFLRAHADKMTNVIVGPWTDGKKA